MKGYPLVILLTLVLTVLGTATLAFITLRYYWGERGTPPLTGEEKRKAWEEETRRRAKQFEHSEQNKWETRSPDFFDNRKK